MQKMIMAPVYQAETADTFKKIINKELQDGYEIVEKTMLLLPRPLRKKATMLIVLEK